MMRRHPAADSPNPPPALLSLVNGEGLAERDPTGWWVAVLMPTNLGCCAIWAGQPTRRFSKLKQPSKRGNLRIITATAMMCGGGPAQVYLEVRQSHLGLRNSRSISTCSVSARHDEPDSVEGDRILCMSMPCSRAWWVLLVCSTGGPHCTRRPHKSMPLCAFANPTCRVGTLESRTSA
jgi:hypothetical protein